MSWVLLIITLLLVGFSRFAKRELSEISASSQLEGQTSGVHVSVAGARRNPSNVVPISKDGGVAESPPGSPGSPSA